MELLAKEKSGYRVPAPASSSQIYKGGVELRDNTFLPGWDYTSACIPCFLEDEWTVSVLSHGSWDSTE